MRQKNYLLSLLVVFVSQPIGRKDWIGVQCQLFSKEIVHDNNFALSGLELCTGKHSSAYMKIKIPIWPDGPFKSYFIQLIPLVRKKT
jgi:hypothetical protein